MMKNLKYLFPVLLFAILFSACKKESYVAKFDKSPQERIGEQIALVNSLLTDAENGWIATLSTGLGGGYGFYMTFDKQQFVKMYADLTNPSATDVIESTYRVRQDMGALLSFDTYTYISILNNPEPGAFGGTIRDGFKSDIDFVYDHSSADSIVFIGKRYRQNLTMVKATAAQKAKYVSGGYLTEINKFKQFFIDNPNAYFDLDNLKVSVESNGSNSQNAGKRMTLTAIYPHDSIASAVGKFAYTIDNMNIVGDGLEFSGISFVQAKWKDATTMALYDDNGKEYIIKNNATPLLPLYKLWGSKYNGMMSDFKQIYPGTSPDGADLINFFHLNMENAYTGYRFNFSRLTFVWNIVNKRLTLNGFSSQSGSASSGWTTAITFNYTVDESGVYTFTLQSDFSGGYVSKAMIPLKEFILDNQISFDYFVDGTDLYGKMSSVTDPDIVMTFILQ